MKKKQLIISILIIILSIALIGFTRATNIANYIIQIVDDGSNNLNGDEQTSITKRIIEDNDFNIVYQVDLKNKREIPRNKEMSILIDTSRSMEINDTDRTMYTIASEFVESIYTNVPDIKMSLSDTTGVKINMSNSNQKDTIKSTIIALEKENGNSIDEGIDIAKTTFSSSADKKYLVIFTDATDKITKVPELEANGIEVITILKDMTRTSYELDGVSTVGLKYMMNSIDIDYICAQINNVITGIKVTDVFTQDILDYFDFEVIDKKDSDTIEKTSTGYIWQRSQLNAGETMTLKFRLKLKENKDVPEEKLYQELYTSENMNVEYCTSQNTKNYDVLKEDSPVIMIGEKYNFILKAVSEENKNLTIEGVKFHVVGTDESGEIVYDNTLTTNNLGEVEIDNLKTIGKVTFTVTPIVNVSGYETTDAREIKINNNITDITKRVLEVETDGLENTIDNDNRKVTVKYPIKTKKFNIEVNLAEDNNSGVKIGNVEFRLIQPKINSRYELNALYGTTASNGKVVFEPTIMPKAGTYDYILSQTSEATDYESMGNVTLKITFDDNGQVTNIEKKFNDKVTARLENTSKAIVNVFNINKNASKFDFQIELSDETNTNDKLEGAIYNVEVTTDDGNTVRYENQSTDENGQINLKLQGTGYVSIKVTEVLPQAGYYQDQTVKEIIARRVDGAIKFLVNNPSDLNTTYTDNSIKLNLTSKMNANQSLVKISLADSEENDILLPNVKVKLIGTMTNEEYDGITDADGIATFRIQPQKIGVYQYKVVVDNKSLPNGYSEVTDEILISIEFDENREIITTSDIKGPILKCEKTEYTDESFTYKVANVTIGTDINEEDQYNFKVNLTDSDSGKAISGAIYEINIDNGTTVRKIPSRLTNNDGEISTRLISSDRITITVKELKSKTGYTVDSNEQTILLKKVNGTYQIEEQGPYDYLDNKNGAIIDGNNIIYKHTNEKKGNNSVLLNLYINKQDKEENLISSLPVRIYSDTLKDSNGQLLDKQLLTDENGYIEIEKIKVTNIEIPKDSEHFLYVAEIDREGNDIPGSVVKLKLTFRYNENKEIVELTNAESTLGNRFLKSKTFNGYETDAAYESNLYLDIYGNITDVGNFSIDFRKLNKDNQILEGAKYDVIITRPDGTKLIKRDLEITDNTEFDGFFVSEGTIIEITEVEAPIGYKLNGSTETLRIETVSDDGSVDASFDNGSTSVISNIENVPMSDGTTKTCIQVDLFDESVNTFKFGITTVDKTTDNGVAGFGYYVFTDRGIQVNTNLTNKEGKINELIGSSHPEKTVTYTIKETETAEYYKKLSDTITLKIVYAEDGTVDTVKTLAAQTDINFGETWEIIGTNTEKGNDIDIKIKNEPQDPFTVELQTVDKITGAEVSGFEYKITPSINLPATGKTEISVGYVAPGSMKTYTLDKIADLTNYIMYKQGFSLVFDENGNIAEDPSGVTDYLEFVSRTEKTVKFKVFVEPKVPIVINSIGYFNSEPLENSEYTIIRDKETKNVRTDDSGKATLFNGTFKQDDYLTYTITENEVVQGYIKLDSFQIKVHFNTNKEIDDVQLVGDANRWIELSYKTPSESTDLGYNGNDKGIVQITLKHYPEFLINIKNQDRLDDTVSLSGTKYTVEASIGVRDDSVITDQNGMGIARLDKTLINDKITYTIKETRAASLYQTIEKDVVVEVYFDENGYALRTEVIDGEDFAEASTIKNITDPRENFEINVTIKNCKMLKFNITAEDMIDNTQKVSGLTYEATSKLNNVKLSSATMQTDANGQGTLGMDKDYANETIEYTIKETSKVAEYQSQGEELKIEVTFDSNGQIIEDSVKITSGNGYTTIARIDKQSFDIDITIKKCKMLKFNITAVDSEDKTYALRELTFVAQSSLDEQNLSSDTIQTDVDGKGTLRLDKNYANKTIIYTIKETKKIAGYQFPSEDLVLEVSFDSQGIIIPDTVKMTSGSGYTTITNVDKNNFTIDLTITNDETEDFGVNIISVDKYDESIKMSNVSYEAYLTTGRDYAKDEKYAGSTVTDKDGEGYIQYGKYVSSNPNGSETRTLRIIEGDVSTDYRPIRVSAILINITFDKNGIIESVSVPGGYISYLGWIADGRFISVTHSRHTLSVTIKHYPYLFMNVKAEDIYTGEALEGKYKISTTKGPGYSYVDVSKSFMQNKIKQVEENIYNTENRGATLSDLVTALSKDTSIDRIIVSEDGTTAQFIVYRTIYTVNGMLEVTKAQAPGSYSGTTGITNIDYIGYGNGEILTQNYQTTNDGKWAKEGVGPTERETERTYYIYEEQAPSSPMQYQQYRPRYLSWEYSKIIATITVHYNEKGRIEKYTIDDQISNNNIKEFLEVEMIDGTNLGITIKYAPITTMEVTAIDNVSKTGLSNIRIYPYQNAEYATRQSYEYRTTGYYTTDTNGNTNYTYWGGNIDNGQNEYHIDTALMGYKGYFDTGRIKIHVAYDEYGRISAADVLSIDGNSMPNAEIVGFENNKLKINILYNRKFYLKIDKQDKYDKNTKLSAEFNITSDKGENTTIRPNNLTIVGMITPGKRVKYTLSETSTPQNYFTLDNIDFYVTFNDDGTVKKVESNSSMLSELNRRETVDKVRQTEVEDLLIAIKNEPQFTVKLKVIDKWYNSKTLENVTFQITNDKGETATGNPVTDNNGALSTIVGKSYQNDVVTYEIRQTSTPNGYSQNNQIIKVKVEFNEQGKIKNYDVIEGQNIVRIDTNQFKDQRYINLNVLNTPKNIYVGIENYDKITNEKISGVEYEVLAQEISGGSALDSKSLITNDDGTVIDTINEFKETPGSRRIVNYTIKQVTKPDSYRKIQDIVLQVVFNEDGSIASRNVLSNPSNVDIQVALRGELKYIGSTPVHILLSIANDNAYDLIIKDEDKNYTGLGIEGTTYDITINGEPLQKITNSDGLVEILSRQDVGNITIRIAENAAGVGYQNEINNDVILEIEKGEIQYSLNIVSNNNPNYATVVKDEEHGIIEVTFKNETRSSIKLVKDNKDVRYKITKSEIDSSGNLINTTDIGTDITDTVSQEELYYELGVTPQNKKMFYTFEELNPPADYHMIGKFNVIVEYDIYGNIKNITTDSNRVSAIENGTNTHDIVVIVDKYVEPNNGNPEDPDNPDNPDNPDGNLGKYGDKKGSLTIIKDNKDVRYDISLAELDANGNYSITKPIGSDLQDSVAKENLYYDLGKLPVSQTFIIRVVEVGTLPDGYDSKGTIEITAKVNEKGLIYEIGDNCEKAEAKLNPDGTNNIVLRIGYEYGSVTLYKDNNQVRYQISSKEKNSDGTYSNEKIINTEEDPTSRKLVYTSIKEPLSGKDIVYTFTPLNNPPEYVSKGSFEVETLYGQDGKISQITNNDYFVTAEANPKDSSDLVVVVLSDEEIEKARNPYTIKVVSSEIDTNLRINNSVFNISVRQGDENLVEEQKGVLTADVSKKGYIVEKGVIKVENIRKDGEINVDVDQITPADGYKFGNQITSGTVKLNVDYQNTQNAEITVLDNARFDVRTDDVNKIVVIEVKNEPEVTMEINNILKTKDEEDNTIEENIEDSKFVITSQIQTKQDITDTDLNVTTALTDKEGNTSAKVGIPYLGKTVLYTIHQIEREEYTAIADIVVLIQYDTKGKIKYYEVISNPDDAKVIGEIGTRNIKLQVINTLKKQDRGYKIVLEKHHIYDGEYEELIPGAKFKIEVEQEYGDYYTKWEAITDSEGLITSSMFDGYGNINIKITELVAPEGFEIAKDTQELRLIRNKNTGKLTEVSSDVNYSFSEDNTEIHVKPVDEPQGNLYTIMINKQDKRTHKQIIESSAKFDVKMIKEENIGTEEEPVIEQEEIYLGNFATGNNGKAKIENLLKPETPGTYKFVITETQNPDKYIKLEEDVILEIEFVEDSEGKIVMGESQILSGDGSIRSKKGDLLNIVINNENEDDVNKYALDITKVDAETNEPIESQAIFKVWLPDEQNTAVYTETSVNDYGIGKLDYCYIEQDKDYQVRLTRMQVPQKEGILKYVFREVIAPEGYAKIDEDIELNIEFKKYEESDRLYIYNITTNNSEYLKINTLFPCTTDTVIDIDILNKSSEQTKYTVHYDANDNSEGTVVPNDQIKEKDVDLKLSTTIPTREGYVFEGWATLPTATTANFNAGDMYTLNQDITLYAVWKEKLYLKSTEYLIGEAPEGYTKGVETEYKEGDMYISRILPYIVDWHEGRTAISVLKDNIETNADTIEIYDVNNNKLKETDFIGTNMTLKLTKGSQNITITIVVTADVNGDGKLTAADISAVTNHRLGLKTLDGAYLRAADVNYDGEITSADKSKMTNVRLNLIEDF